MNRSVVDIPYNMEYSYVFDFEKNYNHPPFMRWLKANWSISIYFSVIYLILVFYGRHWMKSRPKFELRGPLIAWNLSLALFSIVGAFRNAIPELYYILTEHGFASSVCYGDSTGYHQVTRLSMLLLAASKLVELGDTAFIVLRKQPLMFLHWYHHITVMVYTWYSLAQEIGSGRWFGTVNITIHAVMYSYYTLKSMKVNIPKKIAMGITSIQLIQMVVGCYVNYFAYQTLKQGIPCQVTMENIKYSFLMYFSYLLLFSHYFWKAYIAQGRKSSIISYMLEKNHSGKKLD